MRNYFFPIIIWIMLFPIGCSEKNVESDFNEFQESGNCYKARLEKKGMCGQRVVTILEDEKSGLSYAQSWVDGSTGVIYVNVFSVKNGCDFPAGIKEGDTFSFINVSGGKINCGQCEAYTPVPAEEMFIKVQCSNDDKK
jgi:hypothetical protein